MSIQHTEQTGTFYQLCRSLQLPFVQWIATAINILEFLENREIIEACSSSQHQKTLRTRQF